MGEELRLRLFDIPGAVSQDNTEFIVDWLDDIGIPTEVKSYDGHPAHADHRQGRVRPVPLGLDALRRPGPDAVLLHLDQVTTDPEVPLYNDANWCNEEYDALYEQQKVELDPEKRREIVQQMLKIFYEDAPYAVLYQYDILQCDPAGPLDELRAPASRDRTGAVHQHLAGLRGAAAGRG